MIAGPRGPRDSVRIMTRLVLVVMLAAAAGCASSKSAGTCDPEASDCSCSATVTCVDGYRCDLGTGACVLDLDAGVDAPTDAPRKGFGAPCLDKDECESEICLHVGTGGRCTQVCSGGDCPESWGCFGVIGAIEPGTVDEVCVPVTEQLCSPCAMDAECTQIGADRCLSYPDGKQFCGRDCSTVGCPTGFACTDLTIGGLATKQCVPTSGACDCDASNMGATEACTIMTPFMTACAGTRTCAGATGWGSCAPPAMTDSPDGSYQDANCDGIDGEVTRGIFVAGAGANGPNCGLTSATPCQTISFGIVRAVTVGRNQVFVQAGTYNEVVVMLNGVSVYGGYDVGWQRAGYTSAGHVVTITGAQDTGNGGASEWLTVRAHDLIVPVTIADVILRGPMASGTVAGNGRSSYAVHVQAATVRLERVRIEAGNGADGAAGSAGTDAVIVDRQPYMDGARGGDGREYDTVCDTSGQGAGGARGTNSCAMSPSGRGMNGGGGGAGGTMDTSCGFSGSCAVSGNCNARAGAGGANADSVSGVNGTGGAGGSGLDQCGPTGSGNPGFTANGAGGTRVNGGAIAAGYWYGRAGNGGGTGENGGGGGGGGGAGGCDNGTDSYGGGGGGGGAGGCAARGGGGGGGGGGGAFGVFVTGNATVMIEGCALQRGNGGKGGDGGSGGRGQSPGQGNLGGNGPGGATPGSGGGGAHGGHGGGGAGGQGGRSIGLAWTPGSTVTQDCTIGGGVAGAGGASGPHAPNAPQGERDGNDGQAGAAGTLEPTRACQAGNDC